MRFEHILDKDEDAVLSKEIDFDLTELFKGYDIDYMRETTLSANQWKDEAKRLVFKQEGSPVKSPEVSKIDGEVPQGSQAQQSLEKSYMIKLGPMEIKTFVVGMKPKQF